MTFRNTFAVLFSVLLATTAFAVPAEIWEMEYTTDGSQAKGMDVAVYPNDDAVHALVIAGDEDWNPTLYLDRVDGDGLQLWRTEIVAADSGLIMNNRVATLADGGALVTWSINWNPQWAGLEGTRNNLLGITRVASDGSIVWSDTSNTYPSVEKQVRVVDVIGDEIVFSGWWGAGNNRTAHITTYDMDGNHLSTVLVDTGQPIKRIADAELTGDAVFLSGTVVGGGEFVARVDYDGNVIWTRPTQMDLITEMTLGMDGNLYFPGMNSNQNYMVASIMLDGHYNWQRIFEEGIPNPPSQAIVQRQDGRIALWKNNLQLVLIAPDGSRTYEGGTFGEPDEWDSNAIALYENGDLLLSSSGVEQDVLLTRIGDVVSDVEDNASPARVTEFALAPAHPNPFNAMTTLQLAVPNSGPVTVSIIDVMGRTVDQWTLHAPSQGTYEVSWAANNFASGFYFVRAVSPTGISAMQKLVLVR